jgi:hypothetical protein
MPRNYLQDSVANLALTSIAHAMRRAAAMLCAVVVLGASAARADIVISDGSFDPSDWSFAASGSFAFHDEIQNPSGGNPSAFRTTIAGFIAVPDGISILNLFLPLAYNPSLQGAVLSVDYQEDQIFFDPAPANTEIGAFPLLRQGGEYFMGPYIGFINASWETVQLTGLTGTDFSSGSTHPDFGVTGGPIEFGFARIFGMDDGGSNVMQIGIDNWAYTLHTGAIPEPGAAGLLAGLAFVANLRRRRSPTALTGIGRS